MRIERALAVIARASLLPAAADQLRASAKAGTVHYSTLIEGNELPLVEAELATRGELSPDTRAKAELVNYVAALDLLDELGERDELALTPEQILLIHGTLMKGLGRPEGPFKPHHEGAWRDGIAVIPDPISGRIVHEGSPREEVPGRMAGLCAWVADREASGKRDEYPAPVVAGVVHYAITDIHPFADGNGRTARVSAAAVLQRAGYLPGRLFSFEGYYARDKPAYLGALRSVRTNTYNMEQWLGYYLEGLALEYERVVEEIDALAQLGLTRQATIQLKRSQQIALSALHARGTRSFSRAEYEDAAGVRSTQARDDIADLRSKRVIRTIAGTKGPNTRYAFVAQDARGRRPKWTPDRIEAELKEFCANRDDWPTVAEFKAAERWPLYLAVTRNGGAEFWASKLGLNR
jgi:Fic family protein